MNALPQLFRQIESISKRKAHVKNNTGKVEWYSPPSFIAAERAAMGTIDCDPASCEAANRIVRAENFFTRKDNGLFHRWFGNVWYSPYCQPGVTHFISALILKFETGEINQACCLTNNATKTRWFQIALRVSSAVCFASGRVRFVDANGTASGAPLQGQAVFYLGQDGARFAESFQQFGHVFFNGDAR